MGSCIWVSRYVFNMGCRVPLRGRINESIMTGLRVVDTILPIGIIIVFSLILPPL